MIDEWAVLLVIDVAQLHRWREAAPAAQRGFGAEERHEHGRDEEQQHHDDAAAIGEMAEGFLVQQGAEDAPAHEERLRGRLGVSAGETARLAACRNIACATLRGANDTMSEK